jgi:hypothetical protein
MTLHQLATLFFLGVGILALTIVARDCRREWGRWMDALGVQMDGVRHCDDCGFSTVEGDVTRCPDPRCGGSVG